MNLKKQTIIKVRINTLSGLKKAEWYKARVEKYHWLAFNPITETVTFKKVDQ